MISAISTDEYITVVQLSDTASYELSFSIKSNRPSEVTTSLI